MEYKPMSAEEFRACTDGISSALLAKLFWRSKDCILRYRCGSRPVPREIAVKVRKMNEALRRIEEEE